MRASRLDELLLEELDLPRGVGEAAAQQTDLLLEEGHLRLKLVDALLALLSLFVAIRHAAHLPPRPMLLPAYLRLQNVYCYIRQPGRPGWMPGTG